MIFCSSSANIQWCECVRMVADCFVFKTQMHRKLCVFVDLRGKRKKTNANSKYKSITNHEWQIHIKRSIELTAMVNPLKTKFIFIFHIVNKIWYELLPFGIDDEREREREATAKVNEIKILTPMQLNEYPGVTPVENWTFCFVYLDVWFACKCYEKFVEIKVNKSIGCYFPLRHLNIYIFFTTFESARARICIALCKTNRRKMILIASIDRSVNRNEWQMNETDALNTQKGKW